MAKIISIETAVPKYRHKQKDILSFMQKAYELEAEDKRKLAFLYNHSEIESRYSVLEDFGKAEDESMFISSNGNGSPMLDERMKLYQQHSLPLSVEAVNKCIDGIISPTEITHIISVSCTGMSAPGLDLQLAEALELSPTVFRTCINFMGCYAAIHALKLAKMICDTTPVANVVVVCTEICTIHFQKEYNADNAASSLLFGDGSAAVLVSNNLSHSKALQLQDFYAEVSYKGKGDMSWELSSKGFLMTLSSYIPTLIKEDIASLVNKALAQSKVAKEEITHWCIHPGGKKILDVIQSQLNLDETDLQYSRSVLAEYGNMSSPTIVFVLKEMMEKMNGEPVNVFGVAFGPGLTMETFIASKS